MAFWGLPSVPLTGLPLASVTTKGNDAPELLWLFRVLTVLATSLNCLKFTASLSLTAAPMLLMRLPPMSSPLALSTGVFALA